MEDFYIMKKRNKIVAFLLAGVIAAGHGSVVYAAGYGSVVYEDVAWDLCALNEERMKLEVQEKIQTMMLLGMTKQTSKNVNHRRVHLNMLISVLHPC